MTPWNRLRRVICRLIKPPIPGAAGDALSRTPRGVAPARVTRERQEPGPAGLTVLPGGVAGRRVGYLPGRGTWLSAASASPVTSGTAASSGRSGPAMVSKLSKLVRASRTRTASPGGRSGAAWPVRPVRGRSRSGAASRVPPPRGGPASGGRVRGTDVRRAVGWRAGCEAADEDLQPLAAAIVPRGQDRVHVGIERRQRAEPAHGDPVRGPEPGEDRDQLVHRRARVRFGEGPGKIAHLARSGQVVAERLQQPGFRAELVIHGGPGHVGPPGHRVHRERLIAGRLGQEFPGRVQDPAAALVDHRLTLAQLITPGTHGPATVATSPPDAGQFHWTG